jgi:hypothetical protein
MNKLLTVLILVATAATAQAQKSNRSYTDFSSNVIVDNSVKGCMPLYTKGTSNFQVGGTHINEMKKFCEQPVKVEKAMKEDILHRIPGKTSYMKVAVYTYADGQCLIFAREKLVRTGFPNSIIHSCSM